MNGMNLVRVSGLPESVTDEHLKALFAPFGFVISARILFNLDGRSLGCGTVEMSSREEVDDILSTKDRISVGGKRPNIWRSREITELD
jgi:RNA recognition motif-containing protein